MITEPMNELLSLLTKDFSVRNTMARRDAFVHQLLLAAQSGAHVYENEFQRLTNLPQIRELRGQFSLRTIFANHWDDFLVLHPRPTLRPAILDNVDAMIRCRDFSAGYLFFACPHCENFHIQGLSCHSRFCPTCGKKYRDQRTVEITRKCLDVPHRQFVFSIAEELRPYFRRHRLLFHSLFLSVKESFELLLRSKSAKAAKEGRTLGYVQFLHTFGRDLKFNPHIHVLVAERTLDASGKMAKYDYFCFAFLRKTFMNRLLFHFYHVLKKVAPKQELIDFCLLRRYLYRHYVHGFYTHGPKLVAHSRVSVRRLAEYIARYASHPAIAESRITAYDPTAGTVSYYYDPHEDEHVDDPEARRGRTSVIEPVVTFMEKLVVHIPDRGFHTIRYYGFYANRSRLAPASLRRLYSPAEIKAKRSRLLWRLNLLHSYRYDPLLCACGHLMRLVLDLSFLPIRFAGGT